jgi:multiple sugar transport system substrate-binding protein
VDELGKMQIDYISALTRIAVPLPPPPKGADEIQRLIPRIADAVAFSPGEH